MRINYAFYPYKGLFLEPPVKHSTNNKGKDIYQITMIISNISKYILFLKYINYRFAKNNLIKVYDIYFDKIIALLIFYCFCTQLNAIIVFQRISWA